jgi:2-methylcitrate dehydratase
MAVAKAFDEPTEAIIEFVRSVRWPSLDKKVRHGIVRHVLDSIGCAFFAFHESPCIAARGLAATAQVPNGASVIGLRSRTTPEYAAFANGGMIRYLDYNDTFHSRGSGHPSDAISGMLALAEETNASSEEFLLGVYTAYEVFAAVADQVPALELGWDTGLMIEIGAAAGAAKILKLKPDAIGHAISLALTPNLPLGVTRTGHISPWRGFAAAYSTMAGVFAGRLAKRGMTGPTQPFDGIKGLAHRAVPPFKLNKIGKYDPGRSAVERSHIKLVAADYEIQAPLAALRKLYEQGVRADNIEAVNIRTYHLAWKMMGGGQGDHAEKWHPKTRETADHSLPYLVAVVLSDGSADSSSFSPERLKDPALVPVMEKVTVEEDPEIESNWVSRPIHKIEVRMTDGSRKAVQADPARGHASNPATDEELQAKFMTNAARVTSPATASAIARILWDLEKTDDIAHMAALLRSVGDEPAGSEVPRL